MEIFKYVGDGKDESPLSRFIQNYRPDITITKDRKLRRFDILMTDKFESNVTLPHSLSSPPNLIAAKSSVGREWCVWSSVGEVSINGYTFAKLDVEVSDEFVKLDTRQVGYRPILYLFV